MKASTWLGWLALLLATFVASFSLAAPANAQATVRVKCESWQFRPARCDVPGTTGATVSSVIAGDCRFGNWGWDPQGIWVNNGCRANFNVLRGGSSGYPGGGNINPGFPGGGGNPGAGQIVRCESWEYKPARCDMDTRGGVRIQRVIAGNCRQNQTWGWDRNAVWVNGGCRADFISNSGGGWGGGGNRGPQVIECNSIKYEPARCNANTHSGVQIDRVLGGECLQNRTWGWDRGGIWVNNGCRARFRIN